MMFCSDLLRPHSQRKKVSTFFNSKSITILSLLYLTALSDFKNIVKVEVGDGEEEDNAGEGKEMFRTSLCGSDDRRLTNGSPLIIIHLLEAVQEGEEEGNEEGGEGEEGTWNTSVVIICM